MCCKGFIFCKIKCDFDEQIFCIDVYLHDIHIHILNLMNDRCHTYNKFYEISIEIHAQHIK